MKSTRGVRRLAVVGGGVYVSQGGSVVHVRMKAQRRRSEVAQRHRRRSRQLSDLVRSTRRLVEWKRDGWRVHRKSSEHPAVQRQKRLVLEEFHERKHVTVTAGLTFS